MGERGGERESKDGETDLFLYKAHVERLKLGRGEGRPVDEVLPSREEDYEEALRRAQCREVACGHLE